MADTTDQRLDRIEEKLDKLADAMIALARAEEKLAGMAKNQENNHQRVNKLSEKLDDIEKKVEIEGRGNYGLKPTEDRIKDAIGDILLTSDSNVTSYNVVIEAQKESGYTS